MWKQTLCAFPLSTLSSVQWCSREKTSYVRTSGSGLDKVKSFCFCCYYCFCGLGRRGRNRKGDKGENEVNNQQKPSHRVATSLQGPAIFISLNSSYSTQPNVPSVTGPCWPALEKLDKSAREFTVALRNCEWKCPKGGSEQVFTQLSVGSSQKAFNWALSGTPEAVCMCVCIEIWERQA